MKCAVVLGAIAMPTAPLFPATVPRGGGSGTVEGAVVSPDPSTPPHSGCSPQSDELSLQKKLRTEVIQLEDTLAQVRKEYEMLRIEFEQNLAANEQAGNPTPRRPRTQ